MGKALEPYDLFWLEDCTPAENQEALRLVRRHTTTPLAIGEVFNTVWDYRTLITEQLIDYVRSSVTHTGGISPMRRLWTSPVSTRSVPACTGRPISRRSAWPRRCTSDWRSTTSGSRSTCSTRRSRSRSSGRATRFADGLLHPGEQAGLGVELDLDAAAAHPYEPAYLPVNRLRDGTLHDW